MKKLISIVLSIAAAATLFAMTSSAATGIDSNEQKILDLIGKPITIQSVGKSISIPAQYRAAAENYFLTTSMSDTQYDKVVQEVTAAENTPLTAAEISQIKAASTSSTINIKALPESVKTQIMDDANQALAAIGLKASYDGSNLSIVNPSTNEVIFGNSSVLKATGYSAPSNSAAVIAALAAASVLAGAAALYFISNVRHAEVSIEK